MKRRRNILKYTKGFKTQAKSKERAAKERLLHAWTYAFRDRKTKKREFRKLWQTRISAALRQEGVSYSRFINQLKKNSVNLDRKILSELASSQPAVFKEIVGKIAKA